MDEIEIKKKIYEMSIVDTYSHLDREVANQAVDAVDPLQYLRDMYRNNAFKYEVNAEFLECYIVDIVSIIEDSELKISLSMDAQNYIVELGFIALQLTIEKMMIDFGMINREDSFFANYDILDVHERKENNNTVRYGISDIEILSNQTPSKYVQVRNEQGQLLTEAEVYFIEEESDENNK